MTEKKGIDYQQINIISGKIEESKTDFENLKAFIKRWEEKIKEIKTTLLTNRQAYNIAKGYINEVSLFKCFNKYPFSVILLVQVVDDLSLALFQANNNYKKQFPSFWNSLYKLKLPDFNLIKKG